MRACHKHAVRRLLAAALLFASSQVSAQTQSITLTLPQARAAAVEALSNHDYPLAIQLAKGLLQADPKDARAYYIIALAYQKLGDANLSRRAAGFAFRYSAQDLDRFVTSQLAARMALAEKRHTLAQYWLRRSYDYVPNDRLRQQAAADFNRLRALNPWSVRLGLSVDPSDNVNSGAGDPENEIDGSSLPPGEISPSGLALSGVSVNARIDGAYRLRRTDSSESHLTFRAFTRQVILSQEARALLATGSQALDGSDFANSYAEIGLSHAFRLGSGTGNGSGRASVSYGRSYYAGDLYFQSVKGNFDRNFDLGGNRKLTTGIALEHRGYSGRPYSNSATLRLGYSTALQSGAKLSLGLSLARVSAPDFAPNLRNDYANAFVAFEPERKLGPARVSLVAGASFAHYGDYRVGFFPIPGGREDKTLQTIATFTFEDIGFAGFSPEVTLRGRKTQSNVGRFDTSEMTLSIGLKSNF